MTESSGGVMPARSSRRQRLDVAPEVIEALRAIREATGRSEGVALCAAIALTLQRYDPGDEARVLSTELGCRSVPRMIEVAWMPHRTVRAVVDSVGDGLESAAADRSRAIADRSPARKPFADVLLTDATTVLGAAWVPGAPPAHALSQLDRLVEDGTADCALLLCAGDRSWALEACGRDDRIAAWLVEQFAVGVLRCLRNMAVGLDEPIGCCGTLDTGEVGSLLAASRGPVRSWPEHVGLSELFARMVELRPGAPAVSDDDRGAARTLDYRELDRRAAGVARRLRASGATVAPVVVFLARSIEAVTALVAVVQADAVYVPVEVTYPDAYVRRIVRRTAPVAVVTDAEGARRLAGIDVAATIVLVDEDAAPEAGPASSSRRPEDLPADVRVAADAPCLTMFTSGSTGTPKGVVHRERQVLNRLHWMWDAYPFVPGEVMAQRSPLGVMPSMWELLGGLLCGVPTVVASGEVARDPARLAAFVASHRVTRMTMTPSDLRRLAAVDGAAAMLASLRHVTVGGEMLPGGLLPAVGKAMPSCVVIEDYGCTETNTVWHRRLARVDATDGDLPGGRPIANLGAYVIDRHGDLAPRGAVGELVVAGGSLAVEYVGLPDAYERSFVENALDPAMGPTLYRTGDLAHRRRDGTIGLVGRLDHQLKIRGMRVDPSEVEGVLVAHEDVEECAVSTVTGSHGEGELFACVVTRAHPRMRTADVRAFAAERLPAFMVPTRVAFVERLPRLANGKLDRPSLASATPQVPATGDAMPGSAGHLRATLAELLAEDLDEATDDVEFRALGLDSALTVDFANRLSRDLGARVSAATIYEHFTLRMLRAFVVHGAQPIAARWRPALVAAGPTCSQDVAIVGMSCRFPDAGSPDRFWQNLVDGHCAVREIPDSRWSATAHYSADVSAPGRSVSKWGAILDDIADFDPLFFGISPADAAVMDPQIRIGLQEAWRAFEDAGCSPQALARQAVGVFVGMRKGDFERLLDGSTLAYSAGALLGNDPAMLAARIASRLDLHGPGMTVDTACSSSLAAVHLACQSIATGESDVALAGGVCIVLSPGFYVATSKLGIFSPTGRCSTFDRDADGTVQGEGAGFVVLKELERALRDGDHVYAVVKGTGLSQDGRTNGIGAPNPRAQEAVQTAVYERYGIEPATIGYVEAHGTATEIGDRIEVEALTRSFRRHAGGGADCAIGSVKANIGHLNAAAGIAGLMKAALCLQHGELVPAPGCEHPAHWLEGTPFYVGDEHREWNAAHEAPRRAAVNSFGLSGTNVHCVLEEAPVAQPVVAEVAPEQLFFVSARTRSSLRALAGELAAWLEADGRGHRLVDISFTLLTGRERHGHGVAVVASSHDELIAGIRAATARSADAAAPSASRESSPELGERALARLAAAGLDATERRRALGVLGATLSVVPGLDVTALFVPGAPRRVSLPTYAFERRTCWPPVVSAHGDRVPAARAPRAVPAREGDEVTSELLRDALASILGIGAAEIDDDTTLDAYGCDSAAVIDLAARLGRELGVDVPVSVLTPDETIATLVPRLGQLDATRGGGVGETHADLASNRPPSPGFALTDLQAAQMFAKVAGVDGVGCHTYVEIDLARVDLDRLEDAWNRVVAHHPMLRMRVTAAGRQEIQPTVPRYEIRCCDLDQHGDFGAHLRAVRREMSHKLYLPETWPLFEVRVSRHATGSAVMHVSMDSWIVDARGAAIVHEDFQALYDDPRMTLAAPLSEFRDHVERLETVRGARAGIRQLGFWRRKLATSPPGPRLTGGGGGAPQGALSFERLTARVDGWAWHDAQALAARAGVFPASVVAATFARTLATAHGPGGFSLLLTHSHRARFCPAPADRVVGPFTTTSLCVAEHAAERSLPELARALDHQVRDALGNPDVCLVAALGEMLRETGAALALPVVFTAQLGFGTAGGERTRCWLDDASYAVSQTPGVALECRVGLRDGALQIAWDVATTLVELDVARALLADFEARLRSLAGADGPASGDAGGSSGGGVRAARGLTALQEVYLAERHRADRGVWAEGTVYQEFELTSADADRVAAATEDAAVAGWEALDALPDVPALSLRVRDLSLLRRDDALARLGRTRRAMLTCEAEAVALVRVEIAHLAGDRARVHVATSMLAADAYSVLLVYARLFGLETGPGEAPSAAQRTASPHDERADLDHWVLRVTSCPPGLRLPAPAAPPDDQALPAGRRSATLDLRPALRAAAKRHGSREEAILVAALNASLRARAGTGDFTTTLALTGRDRVVAGAANAIGDFTLLTWVVEPREQPTFGERVRAADDAISRDLRRGGEGPIHALSHVNRRGGERVDGPRVVVTSALSGESMRWPEAIEWGFGLSLTPHVDLDCCVHDMGGLLRVHLDYRAAAVGDGLAEAVLDDLVTRLADVLACEDAWDRREPAAASPSYATPAAVAS